MPCLQVLQLILWLCPCVFKWLVIYAALRSLPQILHDTFPSWRTMCVRSLSLVAKAAVHVWMEDKVTLEGHTEQHSITHSPSGSPQYLAGPNSVLSALTTLTFICIYRGTEIKLLSRD